MKTHLTITALVVLFPLLSPAQNFERDLNIPVTVNGNPLQNPWSGGMDAPEYSVIDLNGDNIKDLFVFDRRSNRISTFINNGTPGQVDYHYAPQYIAAFPDMLNWAQLLDFNCDGKEDIFTDAYSGGIRVYLNVTINSLQFALFDSMLLADYGSSIISNIYCPSHGLASFTDVDGDSDLDILSPSNGIGLDFYKNLSFDLYGTCDSLIFVMDINAWGDVNFENGGNESRHYLALDMDSDGDKDLLTNNISVFTNLDFNILKYYENTGNASVASLTLITDTFPTSNDAADVRGFAAAFEFDADNDANKDLIIAPQLNSFHDINNSWFLKDTSSTSIKSYEKIMDNFLCSDMIDVGTVANVRFSDIDNDGQLDIIIGNYARQPKDSNDFSSLYYFHNTGSAAVPAFELVTDNFANSITSPFAGMAPAFGDLDGDLDKDMLVGLYDGTFNYYMNNGGNFLLITTNYQGIDVGSGNTPYLFDINQDGLTDLVCGNRNGKLHYFQNTGTISSPVFTLMSSQWGNLDVSGIFSPFGYSYPVIYLKNGLLELLVGSESGTIFQYGNISGNIMGTFTLVDSIYGGINEKLRLTLDVADINNDSEPDILVGNYNGGAVIYKQVAVSVNEIGNVSSDFILFPNPASSSITVESIGNNKLQIINLLGEICFEKIVDKKGTVEIDISALSSGIYFVKLGEETRKLIITQK